MSGLSEKLKQFTPLANPYKVLFNCKGKVVQISTWGLPNWNITSDEDYCSKLAPASRVDLLIGYSKTTHNLEDLKHVGMVLWKNYGWNVRYLPSFHVKIWIVGRDAYVGSANLAANTIINRMWKVPRAEVLPYFKFYWLQSAVLSTSTDLRLVPCAKLHPTERI